MAIGCGPGFRGYDPSLEDPHGALPSGNLGDGYYDGQPATVPTPEQLKVLDAFAKGEITRKQAEELLDKDAEPGA